MPTDPTNLMGQVYDLFTSLYPNTAGSSAFLAFEKLGLPISTDMFKVTPADTALSPALAIERLSQIANTVLVVSGDSVQHTDRTIDAQLQLLVQQSMPATPDMTAALGSAKLPAGQAFDSMALGSLEGPFTFHPTYASPADWYDPTVGSNWTAHTIGQGAPPSVTPQQPPRPIMLQAPVWRVMPAQAAPVLAQPITAMHPMVVAAPPPRPMAAPMMRPMVAPAVAPHPMPGPAVHPVFVPPPPAHILAPTPAPTPTATPALNVTTVARTNAGIVATTTTQPVTGDSLTITFEHCIVMLTRPWYPQGFMMLRDWYLPGYTKGDVSHGTGVSDTALLPLLPTGFVAIRNLSIRASWSDQDRAAAQQSAAFGPFSLMGRNFDAGSGTLNCPGIQVIGWFLTPLSLLPPNTDPALLPPPPPPPPPSTLDVLTNPQVDNALAGGLTGLFGAASELFSGSGSSASSATNAPPATAPAPQPGGGGSG